MGSRDSTHSPFFPSSPAVMFATAEHAKPPRNFVSTAKATCSEANCSEASALQISRALPVLEAARAVFGPTGGAARLEAMLHPRALECFLAGRSQPTCDARAAAAHYLHSRRGWSFTEIGRLLGRHHSTAIHARDRIRDLLKVDAGFAALYREFEALLE